MVVVVVVVVVVYVICQSKVSKYYLAFVIGGTKICLL